VRRGSITERLNVSGRVADADEVVLSLPTAGEVAAVVAKAGQRVQAGQILVETDSKEIVKELEAARARLDMSAIRLRQAQAQGRAQQRETQRRVDNDAAQRQQAIADAEAALRRALADRERATGVGPAQADLLTAQAAVDTAWAGLERAEADLARLFEGPDPSERRKAEHEARTARAAYERAEADLGRLLGGPDRGSQLRIEQEVNNARLALQRAEADLNRIMRGADPSAVSAAARELALAEAKLAQAQTEPSRPVQNPRPVAGAPEPPSRSAATTAARNFGGAPSSATAVRPSAARGPDSQPSTHQGTPTPQATNGSLATSRLRANTAYGDSAYGLPTPQAEEPNIRIPVDTGPVPIDGPTAETVNSPRNLEVFQLEVAAARERLEALRRGPDPLAADMALAAVASARTALDSAQERQREVQAGAPADRVSAARDAVEAARSAVESAEARLADLEAGPSAEKVTVATNAVNAAQSTLAIATSRQAALTSGSQSGQRDLDERVAAAQAALDRARRAGGLTAEPSEGLGYDLLLLDLTMDQDRAKVATLERQLDATRLRAPFAGVVASVLVQIGDTVEAQRPAVILAHLSEPVIRVDLTNRDAERVAVGQPASVQLEGGDGTALDASLITLTTNESGNRAALFKVAWPDQPPTLGTAGKVAVTVQAKENVLLVPQRAVRSAGTRRYVQLLVEGQGQRNTDVQTGIAADGFIEIVNGLRAGQVVRVGP
jgi:multidrug efflux pump subunit AcrA (membrane-fusion protein)